MPGDVVAGGLEAMMALEDQVDAGLELPAVVVLAYLLGDSLDERVFSGLRSCHTLAAASRNSARSASFSGVP
ncbi:hypothetical protein DMA12_41940 [Amycolatopsis balhimycina DSM 5908]|uniref:Uncharacterized protein n=1 Tax=Amycolatopsis balhimycina DSM 5908 TaxID=1081091 RepID=A0A428VYZ2_AMYBA|nr:hypothetical protein [Amycolatopsis balhimycina]RSM36040.1 hypothetical protein DMA12_41940 [Amycolatopsis balhimycina DSM 5908]